MPESEVTAGLRALEEPRLVLLRENPNVWKSLASPPRHAHWGLAEAAQAERRAERPCSSTMWVNRGSWSPPGPVGPLWPADVQC